MKINEKFGEVLKQSEARQSEDYDLSFSGLNRPHGAPNCRFPA